MCISVPDSFMTTESRQVSKSLYFPLYGVTLYPPTSKACFKNSHLILIIPVCKALVSLGNVRCVDLE